MFVPARMINEVLYCERLLYLEWAQGEFADNVYTLDGKNVHRRVDGGTGKIPQSDIERPYIARSVWLSSERLGITAKIDVMEDKGEGVTVVEYKRGKAPDVKEGAYLPERAQLCAQVMLLKEHGFQVKEAQIFFAESRRRVLIDISDELQAETLRARDRALEICNAEVVPEPLVDSPKCTGCSLVSICLPDELNAIRRRQQEVRRVLPGRDDKIPLHVQEQGTKISLKGDCLSVDGKTMEKPISVRLIHTSGVSIYGNVQITTQALRALMSEEIPVSFFSTGGWYLGRVVGSESKNIEVKIAQFREFSKPNMNLARSMVATKIINSRTILRRNAKDDAGLDTVLLALQELAKKAEEASSPEELLGIEGAAAREYFSKFSTIISMPDFLFEERNRRPPRDPVNALLSMSYALLLRELVVTLARVGLDPHLGFYHRPRYGRPALALDMMEEFRPILADSAVLTAINTKAVTKDDFVTSIGSVALSDRGRRKLISVYEQRMSEMITHPLFGYRIGYRRALEVQARLLSRYLLGELDSYPTFRTR